MTIYNDPDHHDVFPGGKAGVQEISQELRAGIARYDEQIAALGGYGTLLRATMPNGIVREGKLIERGFGGCQPGLIDAAGRRWAIRSLDAVEVC